MNPGAPNVWGFGGHVGAPNRKGARRAPYRLPSFFRFT